MSCFIQQMTERQPHSHILKSERFFRQKHCDVIKAQSVVLLERSCFDWKHRQDRKTENLSTDNYCCCSYFCHSSRQQFMFELLTNISNVISSNNSIWAIQSPNRLLFLCWVRGSRTKDEQLINPLDCQKSSKFMANNARLLCITIKSSHNRCWIIFWVMVTTRITLNGLNFSVLIKFILKSYWE